MRAGEISEDLIKKALTENKGDLFRSACALGCTAKELDRYIRSTDELQVFVVAIDQLKNDPAYERLSAKQFTEQLTLLIREGQVMALEEMQKLAGMSIGDSAAMAQVKFLACARLMGSVVSGGHGGELSDLLAELNQRYEEAAPRIREIRQTVVTLENPAPKALSQLEIESP